ncbi:MAG: single-stranded DNA-binding protein, partial [Agathobacter sp.]
PARAGARPAARASAGSYDGFMNVSEGLEDEGLPFN